MSKVEYLYYFADCDEFVTLYEPPPADVTCDTELTLSISYDGLAAKPKTKPMELGQVYYIGVL